ncbi:immunoglobulin-like domain-containing protein [Bacillus sp. Marseille-P3661]|uniref:immunoglobulin-like domain-containing protein n=1 Tax=Bacillus sp. Marseille-P3661 TaxID=1936234 RepID=UPI000C83A92B|nr:immunoglobulin-like domain-containing protein [Bacillus sp. Marseille-P3661]
MTGRPYKKLIRKKRRLINMLLVSLLFINFLQPLSSVQAARTTIDINDLSSWNNVSVFYPDSTSDAGGGGYELTKFYVANDANAIYFRWDVQLDNKTAELASTNLGAALSTSESGATANAMVWLLFDSKSTLSSSVVNLTGSGSVSIDQSDITRFGEGTKESLVSVVARVDFSLFQDLGFGANFNADATFPLWAQTNASQQPTARDKDRIPDSGYFKYDALNGTADLIGSGATAPSPPTATAGSGTVIVSGQPNAIIKLYDSDGTIVQTGTADGNGNYTFIDVADGTYTVTQTVNMVESAKSSPVTVVSGDLDAPIITLNGDSSIRIIEGATYNDAGATAQDETDGDISGNIDVTGLPADTNTIGTYTIRYNVSDSAGNAAQEVTRTLTIAPKAPNATSGAGTVIASGANPNATLKLYNADGNAVQTGTADSDGTFTFTGVAGGNYTVKQTVIDIESDASNTVTVETADSDAPIITLNGNSSVRIIAGAAYTDAGATASDIKDGDLTNKIKVTGLPADTSVPGTYTIRYNVSDSAGNAAPEVTRTFTIAPAAPTGTGSSGTVNVTGATADAIVTLYDSDGEVVKTGTANGDGTTTFTGVADGTYTVKQTVNGIESDASNTITVDTTDTDAPVITLNGNSSIRIVAGAAYIDAGATASDIKDGDLTNKIKVTGLPVDTSVPGTYTIRYNVSDTTGNAAPEVTRTLTIAPAAPTGTGSSGTVNVTGAMPNAPVKLYNADGEVEQTGTADGNGTFTFTDVADGTYTVKQTVNGVESDESNTITVVTADVDAPVITLKGDNSIRIIAGAKYSDAGATALDEKDGDLTNKITVTGEPTNTTAPGTYTIRYNVSDTAGNPAQEVTRTLIIAPAAPTGTGSSGKVDVTGATPNETVTLYDANGNVVTTGTADDNGRITFTDLTSGNYTVKQTVNGVDSDESSQINVDSTKPVITLVGDPAVRIIAGTTYTDAGATATDETDGDLTNNITVSGLPDNINTPGTYTIRYNVSDEGGNTAQEVTRTLTIAPPAPSGTGSSGTVNVTGAMPNETVTLYDAENNIVKTGLANDDGTITFTGVSDGTYTVKQTVNSIESDGNQVNVVTIDSYSPVITLVGDSSVRIIVGAIYTDAGATATDEKDGDLTNKINVAGVPTDTTAPGTYTIRYNVSDAAGNTAQEVTRTLTIAPAAPSGMGSSGKVDVTGAMPDATVTLYDANVNEVTTGLADGEGRITFTDLSSGNYTVKQTVNGIDSDKSGQIYVDSTKPVITLVGDTAVRIIAGATYTDAGANATDETDGDLTNNINVTGLPDNINTPGTYTIHYNVSDMAGNQAQEVTRKLTIAPAAPTGTGSSGKVDVTGATPNEMVTLYDVNGDEVTTGTADDNGRITFTDLTSGTYTVKQTVNGIDSDTSNPIQVDSTVPVITLVGDPAVRIIAGATYTDAGANATDETDGDLTNNINVTGIPENINTPGTYTIRYNVTDTAGNAAQEVTRTLTIAPAAPIGTGSSGKVDVTGATPNETVTLYDANGDEVTTGTADNDGTITFTDLTSGNYTVKQTVNGVESDASSQIYVDSTKPVITLVGDPAVRIIAGATYTDAGANATDETDGDLTNNINVTGLPDNINTPGTYTIHYNVSDMAGNQAQEVTRTLTIAPAAPIGTGSSGKVDVTGAMPDATVTLYDASGNEVTTGTADGEGSITFTDLTSGNYTVKQTVNGVDSDESNQIYVDSTKPVITLVGDPAVRIIAGATYTDAGANAIDETDGDLTNKITITGVPDTTTAPGIYTIGYNVSDTAGNAAQEVTRTLTIAPATPTGIGSSGEVNVTGAMPNATVTLYDTNGDVVTTGTANGEGHLTFTDLTSGNYTVKQTVNGVDSDESNQINVDSTKPVITLVGDPAVRIIAGATYTDAGANATDETDGDLTNNINVTGIPENINTPGTYTIRYNVTDTAGNAAQEVTRTLTIAPAAPIGTGSSGKVDVTGATPNETVTLYDANGDEVTTGTADNDGTITFTDLTSGNYTVKQTVNGVESDASSQIYVDSTKPVITLVGDPAVRIIAGATYTDAGANATDETDGDLTNNINVTGLPDNINTPGTYTIHYNVSDMAGNQAQEVTRTLTIAPAAPIGTGSSGKVDVTGAMPDATVTLYDANGNEVTTGTADGEGSITFTDLTSGNYTVKQTVNGVDSDESNQIYVDSTKPVITLVGDPAVRIIAGATYTDAGANATDETDGDLTNNINVTGIPENINTPGTYTILYNVSDAAGNAAQEVTRTLTIAPAAPTGTGSSGKVDVTGATPNATVTLYDANGNEVTTGTADGEGNITFTDLTSGNYTVKQTVNGVDSDESNQIYVDSTKPVITLVGDPAVRIIAGATYTDAGATAIDEKDGDLTNKLSVNGIPADTATPGIYTIRYNVSDTAGNQAQEVTRTLTIAPTTPTGTGSSGKVEVTGATPNATVTLYDEDGNAVKTGTADNDGTITFTDLPEGTYTVKQTVNGVEGDATGPIFVDTTGPVITLVGDPAVRIIAGATYTDAGASATDETDGDISNNIVIAGIPADTTTPGTYTIRFNVSDAAGNQAQEVTRTLTIAPAAPTGTGSSGKVDVTGATPNATVTLYDANGNEVTTGTADNDGTITFTDLTTGNYTVKQTVNDVESDASSQIYVDSTKPVIALVGDPAVRIVAGATYTDSGANATDETDGDISNNIVITGIPADTATPGIYTIRYNVSDTAGNQAQEVTRTLTIAPTTPTGTGSSGKVEVTGATPNATVTLYDEDGNAVKTGTADNDGTITFTDLPEGTYTVKQTVNGVEGDATGPIFVDTTGPVITLVGDPAVRIIAGATYTDAGASATDETDGDISNNIVIAGIPADTTTPGTYTIRFNVSDAAGNQAQEVTRTLTIAPAAPTGTGSSGKVDVTGATPNATVTLYDANGNEVTTGTADNDGTITFTDLTTGNYTVKQTVNDVESDASSQIYVDSTKPVIALVGDPAVRIVAGATYTDSGANATDETDGDISNNIVITGIPADTTTPGTYTIRFNVSDAAGNQAQEVTRTLTIAPAAPTGTGSSGKVDVTGATPNATVTLYDANGNEVTTGTADNDGTITFTDLTTGNYTVKQTVNDVESDASSQIYVDSTKPVIALVGDPAVRIVAGATYTDSGANATDETDGDISNNIVITGIPANTTTPGTYTINYNVSDTAGNQAQEVTRTLTIAPVAPTGTGSSGKVEVKGATPNATVTLYDANGNEVTTGTADDSGRITFTDLTSGNYTVKQTVNSVESDLSNQIYVDSTKPVITLVGDPAVRIIAGATYTDAGASATDETDGDISNNIVIAEIPADTATPGTYTIRYNVSDTAGNQAQEVTRTLTIAPAAPTGTGSSGKVEVTGATPNATVTLYDAVGNEVTTGTADNDGSITFTDLTSGNYTVKQTVNGIESDTSNLIQVDSTKPVISLVGDPAVRIIAGTAYTDAGATATDETDGDISNNIVIAGIPADTATPGTYTIRYNVSDTAGNQAQEVTRTLTIAPTTPTGTGSSGKVDVTGATPNATVTLYDEEGNVVKTGTADNDGTITFTDVPEGTYTVKQTVNDVEGDATGPIYVDTTGPVITLVGDPAVRIIAGTAYTDAGATATDETDGDISNNIVIAGIPADTATPGTYTIRYNVSDTAGNQAQEVTRTLTIAPTTPTGTGSSGKVDVTGATPNATVTLYDEEGNVVKTGTADNDGTITFTDVPEGTYTVKQTVNDVEGDATGPIYVDTTGPVITLVGDPAVRIIAGTAYTDAGATATDETDGDISNNIVIAGIPADTATPGTYTIRYNVSDTAGNQAQEVTRTLTIAPTTPTGTGSSGKVDVTGATPNATVTLYDEEGNVVKTGTADNDGTITFTDVPEGTYTVKQTVNDVEGDATDPIHVDTTGPVISLVGDPAVRIIAGATYTDAGANATDETDGDISNNIVITGIPADTATPGTYTIRYNVSDTAGNQAQEVTRTLTIAPTTPTATGSSGKVEVTGATPNETVTLYDEEGNGVKTGTADNDGTITFTDLPEGDYTVKQTVNDIESDVTGPIHVDNTVPVITLVGEPSVQIIAGTTYTDAGATATDETDGDISNDIVTTGIPADTATPGVYTIRYNVSDAAGNAAQEVTRSLTIIPSAPAITATTDGSGSVTVHGSIPGAEVILYDKDGNEVGKITADQNGSATFNDVPAGINYTVTQSINGQTSGKSNNVNVLKAIGSEDGVKTVTVHGATPGSTVSLYNNKDVIIKTGTPNEEGILQFTDVPEGIDYYVTETVAGNEGDPSNKVNVYPKVAVRYSEGDIWESVTKPVFLVKDQSDTTITWTSDKPNVVEVGTGFIIEEGRIFPEYTATVHRQPNDTSVILTAKGTKNGNEYERTFLLIVKGTLYKTEKETKPSTNDVQVESGNISNAGIEVTRTSLTSNDNAVSGQLVDKLLVKGDALPAAQDDVEISFDDKPNGSNVRADEIGVEILAGALGQINNTLKVNTPEASINIPAASLTGMKNAGIDLFFHIVPIRSQEKRNEVIQRTRNEMQNEAGNNSLEVLDIPREIETNYTGYSTEITLPLDNVNITANEVSRLRLLIEHTDGTIEIITPNQNGTIVVDGNGRPIGLTFSISKFSTFTFFKVVPPQPPSGGGGGSSSSSTNELKVTITDHEISENELKINGETVPNKEVTIYLDEKSIGTVKADSQGEFTYSIDISLLKEGVHDIYATVKDSDGDSVKSNGIKFALHFEHLRYVNGYPDGQFKPLNNITRAEMAAILSRILEVEDAPMTDVSYPDVPKSFWGSDAIKIMNNAKLMVGYEDGNFYPNKPITRGEMAATILRYMKDTNQGYSEYSFKDITSHWARNDIEKLQEKGIMKGYPDGLFYPSKNLTREEAVVIINRVLNRGGLYGEFTPTWPDVKPSQWSYHDIEEASTSHEGYYRPDGNEAWIRFIEE